MAEGGERMRERGGGRIGAVTDDGQIVRCDVGHLPRQKNGKGASV